MKIAIVICEYNPFQNGHAYHLAQTREKTGCDKIICIMSGNFTQRGELAIADKYERAKWAIKYGADLVLELPPQYVLTSAEYFALGAIKIANAVKGEKILSFGSESEDLESLKKVASFKENEEFAKTLNTYLKQGFGYAKSFSLALKESSADYAEILSSPNNILAIEYIKAIEKTSSDVAAVNVKRQGANYSDKDFSPIYSSASAVRDMFEKNDFAHIEKSVPAQVRDYLLAVDKEEFSQYGERMFSLIKYVVATRDLKSIHAVKEGIENRIKNCAILSKNKDEFYQNIRSKRYTDSYLSRTLANILIDNKYSAEKLREEKIDYVNILAVEENSKDLLSLFDCDVTVKSSALPKDSHILSADSLYSAICRKNGACMTIVKR